MVFCYLVFACIRHLLSFAGLLATPELVPQEVAPPESNKEMPREDDPLVRELSIFMDKMESAYGGSL